MEYQSKTYVYGHVFESLTAGLYPNKQEILREYVQNAYDAIIEARLNGITDSNLIRLQVDGNNLFIHDEGIGMDKEATEEYRYFGFSRKRMESNVGFRGIGKLAGLTIAKTMVVVTKRKGSPYCYTYKCEAGKMLDAVRDAKMNADNIPLDGLIEQYSSINEASDSIDKHYTSVQLYGIVDEDGYLTDPEQIADYLGMVAPVPFNSKKFQYESKIQEKMKEYLTNYQPVVIQVNGKPVYKPFIDELPLHDLKFIEIKGRTKPIAFCWYLTHREAKQIDASLPRGLVYRCKGFTVGNESLVRNTIFSAGRSGLAYWYAGEIHVLEPGIIPSSSRTDFEDTPLRQKFYEAATECIAKPLLASANKLSSKSAFKKEAAKADKKMREVTRKIDSKKLVKETTNKVVSELRDVKDRLLKKAASTKDPKLKQQAEEKARTIDQVTKTIKNGEGTLNIEDELRLFGDAKIVYQTIIKVASEWFSKNAPDELDSFIKAVHRAVERRG